MTDADDLYGLPRADFIAARRELARRVRDAGDRAAAAEIEKLPKPTTAAWLVNQLVRAHPDAVEDLLALGTRLRDAHGRAAGPELRELGRERTELVRSLVKLSGTGLSEAITRELEDMFGTAVADEAAGETLRAGRLATAKDLRVEQTWPGLTLAPSPPTAREPARQATKPKPGGAADRRRKALAEAKAAVKDAESDRADADRAVRAAEDGVAAAEQRVRELNAELDAAEHAELDARRQLQAARRDAKAAERTAGMTWRRLQQVEAAD
ncbi:hypothetical protein [Actinokineospora sp. NBRC 105648]|uniref:hypothetical protein n=1 Tax=Actinokineospora sp. NBRC 105648 TaxID=3032206 RepID=UPI00255335E8|nr:hypothetical protein [Actinokineospora sp. NBRC 105648]